MLFTLCVFVAFNSLMFLVHALFLRNALGKKHDILLLLRVSIASTHRKKTEQWATGFLMTSAELLLVVVFAFAQSVIPCVRQAASDAEAASPNATAASPHDYVFFECSDTFYCTIGVGVYLISVQKFVLLVDGFEFCFGRFWALFGRFFGFIVQGSFGAFGGRNTSGIRFS